MRTTQIAPFATAIALTCGCAATVQRGNELYAAGNCKGAIDAWLPLAKAGDKGAEYNMSIAWSSGCQATGMKVNFSQAAKWAQLAAEQEFPPAFAMLGMLYYDGKGVAEDRRKGLIYLNYAARWDVDSAKRALRRVGQPVPSPDLKEYAAAHQRVDAQQRAEANEDAAAVVVTGMLEGLAVGLANRDDGTGASVFTDPRAARTSCRTSSDCSSGLVCMKADPMSAGMCGRAVDAFGTPAPSLDSKATACTLFTDCPIGFRCVRPSPGARSICAR